MAGSKLFASAAAMLLASTSPTLAQTEVRYTGDGTPYCQTQGATLLGYADKTADLNVALHMASDPDRASFAGGPGMFDTDPEIVLFFTMQVDAQGQPARTMAPFSISASFGSFTEGRKRGTADTLKLGIEAGGVKSPPLTISTMARDDGRVSATLVEAGTELDARDVTVPKGGLTPLSDAILAGGGTLTIRDGNSQIARVPVPRGDVMAERAAALAWARNAYPLLMAGQCPAEE